MTDTDTTAPEAEAEAKEPKEKAPTLQERKDAMFSGKKFEVVKEVHLEKDQHFVTPFGHKGRHGYAIREVGNPDNKMMVGETLLKQIAEDYGAVEVPVKERKRRTKEQKEADEAAAAAAKDSE